MKIESWDIGSDNLAYTIMYLDTTSKDQKDSTVQKLGKTRSYKKTVDLKNCQILKFDLINLFDPNKSINYEGCCAIVKSGIRKGLKCDNNTIDGLKYCGKHTKERPLKLKTSSKKRFYIGKKKLCNNMINILNKKKELTDVDVIVIEVQPPKNKMMSEISHYLYMYLMTRLNQEGKTKVILEYLTARKRMFTFCKLFKKDCSRKKIVFRDNKIKADRKKNAITLTNYLTKNCFKTNKDLKLDKLRKKDDISDCVIQTLWYLVKKKYNLINMR